jgi:hypothetical protein
MAAVTRRTLRWLAPPWTRAPTRLTLATAAAPATGPGRPTCRRASHAPARSAARPLAQQGSRLGRPGRRHALRARRTAHGHGPRKQHRSLPAGGHGPDGAKQTAEAR